MSFQQFVPLLFTLVLTAVFFLYQPPSVYSEEKVIVEAMCPDGEFIVGLQQRYYWWKFGPYSGGVGIGNLSIFCSSLSGSDAEREGKKPNFVWGFQGDPLLGADFYPDAVIYNETWEQLCQKPMEMSGDVRLTKVSNGNLGTVYGAVTEHLVLNCCSENRQRENLVPEYEVLYPVKQCTNETVLAGVCGLSILYDDGIYSTGYWDNYWGVRNVTPICCEVGSGRIV